MNHLLVDSGPLVALINREDDEHARCLDFLSHCRDQLLVLPTVLTGTCYMIGRERGGASAEAALLEDVADGQFTLVELTAADLRRTAALVRQYDDLPLGTVDASVVAAAERLGIRTVATPDVRHFSIVRPQHCHGGALVLLL